MVRSRWLRRAAVIVVVALTAGCLVGTGADTPTSTAPEPSVATGTPDTATATVSVDDFEFSPGRETPVQLRNDWDEWVEIRVQVFRATRNETVHDDTYEVAPNRKPWTVYDLSRVASDESGRFRVVVAARGTTENVTLDVTECADVTGQVTESGELEVWATC